MYTFNNTQKILNYFLENPFKEFHVREIARLSKLSPSGSLKILKKLESKRFITKEKTQIKDNYKANCETNIFLSLKLAHNIYLIKSSGVVDYIDDKCVPEAIVLFGSYSRGDNHSESDIDIAVFKARKKNMDLSHFEMKLNREINISFLDDIKKNPELSNNIINGLTLKGYVKVL
ncbi:hypothetical protein GF327_05955 [Candidatus Woesearchaeota archaeon]|nr:hypothetical protein [Candidatus Woesearchaeota archaeon]